MQIFEFKYYVQYPTKTKMNFPPTDAKLHGNHFCSSTYGVSTIDATPPKN